MLKLKKTHLSLCQVGAVRSGGPQGVSCSHSPGGVNRNSSEQLTWGRNEVKSGMGQEEKNLCL